MPIFPQNQITKVKYMPFRFFCLKLGGSNWTRFAQLRVSLLLLVSGIALTVMSTVAYEVVRSPNGNFLMELCTTPTTHYSVILNEYKGYVKVYGDGKTVQIVGILIKQFELVIYFLIFRQSLFCALIHGHLPWSIIISF